MIIFHASFLNLGVKIILKILIAKVMLPLLLEDLYIFFIFFVEVNFVKNSD